ncbi:glycosyltransferase [Schlesneria paludicola]|uniref:glycosyltransferase n=1 Tax=Schlesneria paludicola TaxID=360056 RepID=UPI000299FE6C|nr:glycosyltransferase family 2 protein [Schlesneria paludicola]
MISFGLVAAIILTGLAVLAVWQFQPCLKGLRGALAADQAASQDYSPAARVILCLRGADPFLDRCLRGLVNQDYPEYKVLIVVDSPTDSAVPQVESLLREYGADCAEMIVRDRILPRCSRRASSLFCGLNQVPTEVQVVVMCDADAIPHRTWLRELVTPLAEPLTVATSGNRWYAPLSLTMGGLCRYYWNALAFRAMHQYQIPWCGSLAMRGDLFRDPQFLDCLQHAFSEDTALAGYLMNKAQQAKPIVSLIVLNEETIGLKNFWGFLVRQMLAARLNHPHWPTIFVEAMAILVVMWILLPLSIMEGTSSLAWWCAGAVIYDGIVLATIGHFEWLVRRHLWQSRDQRVSPIDWKRFCLAPIGLSLTGFIYPLAVLSAVSATRHEWRGIVYRIERRGVSTLYEREAFNSLPANQFESV